MKGTKTMTPMRDDWAKIYQAMHELTERSGTADQRKLLWYREGNHAEVVNEARIRWRGDPRDLTSVIVSVECLLHGGYHVAFEDVVTADAHMSQDRKIWRFVTRQIFRS